MSQEPADEIDRRESHGPPPATMGVVLPAECDLAVREAEQAVVADSRSVRVPRQGLQHSRGPAPRRLGVHAPFGADRLVQEEVESLRPGQRLQPAAEAEPPLLEGGTQPAEELASEHTAEDADRQEKVVAGGAPTTAVEREPAAGDDAMDVRVQRQVL